MKLKQLILHNMASIEDATIDFEADPLVNSEVFLISGKTGSGKSTLLDAICLALYDDTPRMRNLKMEGKFDEVRDSLSIKDPRQLMRQHTGEAYVRLSFEGNDGLAYEAQWSVARARKRENGKLQDRQWSLLNVRTGQLLSKVQEVKAAIQSAVGLDFGQFCRTTLLAQGEFTRFLNSNDNEKAIILEKITGMEAYARIGRKIYEITRQKEVDYQLKRQEIEAVQLLSDEEIAERQERLRQLDASIEQLQTAKAVTLRQRDWLTQYEALSRKRKVAEAQRAEIVNQMESVDFRRREQETSAWKETVEARALGRNWRQCVAQAEVFQQELQKKEAVYLRLSRGLCSLQRQRMERKAHREQLQVALQAEAVKAPVYAQSQAITEKVSQWRQLTATAQRLTDEIVKETAQCQSLQTEWEKVQLQAGQSQQQVEDLQRQLTTQQQVFAQMGLPALRQTKEQLNQKRLLLNNTKHSLQSWEEAKLCLAQHEQEAVACQEKQAELARQQVVEQQLDAQYKAFFSTCQQHWEAQKRTIDKWAKAMRAQLKAGDHCPVCGQVIPDTLPQEAALNQVYREVEAQLRAAQKQMERQQERLAKVSSVHSLQQELVQQTYQALEKERLAVQAKAQRCLADCQQCHIEEVNEQTAQTLADYERILSSKLLATDQQIQAAERFEQEVVEQLRLALEKARQAHEAMQQKLAKCEHSVALVAKSMENHRSQLDAHQNQSQQTAQAIEKQLEAVPVWKASWATDPEVFLRQLRQASERYAQWQQEEQQAAQAESRLQELLEQVEVIRQEVWRCQPAWPHLPVTGEENIKQLLAEWNQFYADLRSALDQSIYNRQQQEKLKEELDHYVAAHPDYTWTRLAALDQYAPSLITEWSRANEAIRQLRVERESALRQIQQDQTALEAQKPLMEEETQLVFLESLLAQQEQALKERLVQKGTLQSQLDQDAQNRANQLQLIAEAEKRKLLYTQWSRLNELLGSADGQRFRKIAQSYVLGHLIHAANHYLQMLTNRYELQVVPGTFIISLEDAYQGYTRRMASTLSGGESFLVSLSLALALSDISADLKVDTLFIDEGFGTLSEEHLQQAVQTLRMLHKHNHRQVGIISHVEELRERIPVQIQVIQEGHSSSSKVEVVRL
ncbi:MAG: AAA family ATPase [Parabacteroides sp.]|nr:AAA family ATPase [Parabacteroides sp.]